MQKKFYFYTDIRKFGNKILHRGYENGQRINEEVLFEPSVFIHTPDDFKSDWTDIYGKPITKLDFGSINECEDFYKRYDGVSGMEISGHKKYAIQFSHHRYPDVIEYEPSLIHTAYQDIEVHSDSIRGFPFPHKAEHPVVTISSVTSRNTIFCTSLVPQNQRAFSLMAEIEGYPVEYVQARDEKHLLLIYLEYLAREDFDILSGWYCAKFDFPYLYNRMKKIIGEPNAKKLSPHGFILYKQFEKFGKIECDLDVYGIQILDYLELFQKFAKVSYGPQEDYKLNTIANVVLGEKKIDYSEYGSLKNLYNENPKLHTEYCIKDSLLVKQMNDKLRYINIALSMSYKGHVNYSDSLGVTELWDSYIYGELLKKNVCVPPYVKHDSSGFEGAYVKPVITGLHKWVVSVDIKSLYPHILAQYNISPETLGEYIDGVSVDSLVAGNFPDYIEGSCVGAKGWTFSKSKLGIIPELVLKGLSARDELKTKMIEAKKEFNSGVNDESRKKILEDLIIILDSAQAAEKELLNSLYGALGAGAFRYFDYRLAETVTLTGQVTIKTLEKTINGYLQSIMGDKKDRIVAMDTDSVVGDSLVYSNNEKIKIEDLYDKFSDISYSDDFNKSYVKPVCETTTLSFNKTTKLIERKKINYIMKHKVKKNMYKITCRGNHVIVTEDHSIEIIRNGRLISVKPSELIPQKDKIININTDESVSIGMIKCQKNIQKNSG